ncbi:MAG: ubiquinol-cytochrome c reductase iron-sulfur subunit [Caulobacteraceae bacterium]
MSDSTFGADASASTARGDPGGNPHEIADPGRRDFIHIMAGAAAVGGACMVAWPLIDQLNPAADTLAQGGAVTVDLSKVQPGQQITVLWRKNPIFIVNRTPAALAELKKTGDLDQLKDPNSKSQQQPSYAKNWSRAIKPEYLVLVGICTHLGCIPTYEPGLGSLGPTWPGGWLCPCHGSRYDLAGRVMKGSPAPLNLPVPPYTITPTSIVIGKNPGGQSFDLADVNTL